MEGLIIPLLSIGATRLIQHLLIRNLLSLAQFHFGSVAPRRKYDYPPISSLFRIGICKEKVE